MEGRMVFGGNGFGGEEFILYVMIRNFIAVMVGGAVGAALRYGVGLLTAGWRPLGLPGGTMAVNVAGCLILGVAAGLVARSSMAEPWSVMLTAGFCGALTTFSTFSGETVALVENGRAAAGLAYVALSVCLGYGAFVAGRWLIK